MTIVQYKFADFDEWKIKTFNDDFEAHDEAAALLLEGYIVQIIFKD